MHVARTFEELARVADKVYLAIGVFDGVHLGHQRVIGQARDDAQAAGAASVVLTFDPHPMRVLQPDHAPLLLTATPHKLALIEKLGADACLLLKFDNEFAQTPPEQFIELVARKTPRLQEICVGTRFRFGRDRAGDVRLIEQLAPNYGFTLREIQSVHTAAGEMISSSAVRRHISHGQLAAAAAMLGRPFTILGTVEHGDRVGHQLGFPTANLNPHNEALPPDGVYAVRVRVGTETFGGVLNIGVRPTIKGRSQARVIEVHLLDFNRDLYTQSLEVQFVEKLRGEKNFESVPALQKQITADIAAARIIIPPGV
jgi:riboflavin kinase/FMN adenylyltransferase